MSTTPRAFCRQEPIDNCIVFSFCTYDTYSIPSTLLTCSIGDFQTILTLGDKYLQQAKSLSESSLRESFLGVELQKLTSEFEQEKDAQRRELVKSHEKEIGILRKQISELQVELSITSKSDAVIREQERAASQRVIDMIEKKNKELLDAKEAALSQRELAVSQKEVELQTKLLRQASSSLRGQDGEAFFENLAKEKKGWNLNDTSKIPHAADYQSTIHNTLCLFEVKHYTHPVPGKEITKFLRDMKENPSAHFGAFISLNTNIQGRDTAQSISFDWIHNNQCVVYFQKCAELDMDYVFAVMDEMIKITSIVNRLIQDSSTSQEPIYQTRIERAKSCLEGIVVKLNETIRKIREDRQRIINIVESSAESRVGELRTIVSGLSRSLEVLLGESIEVSEEQPDLPPLQAKKKPAAKKVKAVPGPILTIPE